VGIGNGSRLGGRFGGFETRSVPRRATVPSRSNPEALRDRRDIAPFAPAIALGALRETRRKLLCGAPGARAQGLSGGSL